MANQKILIVDDEPFNVDYLEQELAESDYTTTTAANGREALAQVQREPPDLILLDIMMPVMDGFEVLTRLKADPATRDIPIIVISANNDLRSVVRGIELGAEDYLPKPFEPTLLHARISSSLEKKHLRDLQQLYLKGLERELEIGREIQQGFLPSALPEVDCWEVAAYFQAAREVAGDFYDAFLLPDRSLMCVVGDVCGKGVGAALFMTLFRSLIRITATTDIFRARDAGQLLKPADRLLHVTRFTNAYLTETHGEASMFATLFLGIFNLRGGILHYINCGNEPPLLIRNGCPVAELLPTGPVIGLLPRAAFAVKEITMETGDILLAFTDGVPDARSAANLSFDTERLIPLLSSGGGEAAGLLKHVEEQLHQFIGTASQFDDITMMAVKRLG